MAVIIAALAWTSQAMAYPVTPENTYLSLRKQMASATTPKQQKAILAQICETGTFQGLMYAAQFLQDERLRKTAAQAVVRIALTHPEYNGANTRQLLELAAERSDVRVLALASEGELLLDMIQTIAALLPQLPLELRSNGVWVGHKRLVDTSTLPEQTLHAFAAAVRQPSDRGGVA